MPRRVILLFASLLTLGLAPSAQLTAEDLKADPEVGKRLLIEGNELADKGDTTEALLRYKRAFEQLLPGLRKLPFHAEVKRDVTAREDLKDYLIKDFETDMTPEEFRLEELGLKALGLIPRDLDYKQTMIQVLSEEVAAFYDPRTRTVHLIREPGPKAVSLLERLLGKTGGFDKDENQTVLAHELTHALADQHFDLLALHNAAKGDDDMDLALNALIEGEATLTMMAAQMKDWDGATINQLSAEDLDSAMSFIGPFLPMLGGKSLRSAPPVIRELLTFPYLRGLVFCTRLVNDGGWKAIDDAYRNPPTSTEQVLHPDKYQANPDPPQNIDLGKLNAGDGWKEVGRNVVGELQLLVMLKPFNGRKAAAGWDGDRFVVFEGPDRKLGLVWMTTWDTEEDAREFVRSYARFQATKLGSDTLTPEEMFDSLRRDNNGAVFLIERHGQDVVVVEGFSPETGARLRDASFQAQKSEKRPNAVAAPANP